MKAWEANVFGGDANPIAPWVV